MAGVVVGVVVVVVVVVDDGGVKPGSDVVEDGLVEVDGEEVASQVFSA